MSGPRYSITPAMAVFDVDRVTPLQYRVLAAFGTYTDRNGWCFPSQKELTSRLKIARSTLCLAVKHLSDIGYMEVRPKTAKGRGKVGNEYRVRTDLPDVLSPMFAQPDIGSQVSDVAPMSDAEDIGKSNTAESPSLVAQAAETAPLSDPMDNGPMSGQPDSQCPASADIGYKEGTTPIERTHVDLFGSKEPQRSTDALEPKASKRSRKRTEYTDEFEAFWQFWPKDIRRNSVKPTAAKRWAVARKRWDAETLMRAASGYLSCTKVHDSDPGPWAPRTCQAEVFLNGKLEAAVEAAPARGEKREVWDTASHSWVAA